MSYDANKNKGIVAGKDAVWSIKVRVLQPETDSGGLLQPRLKYWKLKVILN